MKYPSLFAPPPILPCLFFLLFTPLATPLEILLPLYLYPADTSASAWSSVTTAIASSPSTPWRIIVNPSSGPGVSGTFPTDANYIAAIAKLNSYPNVHTVGYIDTKYMGKSIADVESEVSTYAKWASYAGGQDIHIGGVFFDDVPSTSDEGTFSYYRTISAFARNAFGGNSGAASMSNSTSTSTDTNATDSSSSSAAHIVFNPGFTAPAQLYSYCDTMVEFEGPWDKYEGQVGTLLGSLPVPGKSMVMVNTVPVGADVADAVAAVKAKGLQSVFFGDNCCYNAFDGGVLGEMVRGVGSG